MAAEKRISATKARIEECRANSALTDAEMLQLIATLYPDKFVNQEDVIQEVIKEIVRDGKQLNTQTFTETLQALTNGHKLNKYDAAVIEEGRIWKKFQNMISHIYTAVQDKDVTLTDIPEYDEETAALLQRMTDEQISEVTAYYISPNGSSRVEKKERKKRISQELYYHLNLHAMYETSGDSSPYGNYINFHVYELADGSILLSKQEHAGVGYKVKEWEPHRMADGTLYDSRTGKPIPNGRQEEEDEDEEDEDEPNTNVQNNGAGKSGCMGMLLFFAVVIVAAAILI